MLVLISQHQPRSGFLGDRHWALRFVGRRPGAGPGQVSIRLTLLVTGTEKLPLSWGTWAPCQGKEVPWVALTSGT